MSSTDGRKYKSRSQPPCDACRKRRVACVRLPGFVDCSLCQTRSTSCTYLSTPAVKSGRAPGTRTTKHVRSTSSVTSPGAYSPTNGSSANSATLTEPTRWITQFIGLSGDQDPFVLRHCRFDAHCYKRIDWACLRVNNDVGDPAHFSVVPDVHLDARVPHLYMPDLDVHKMIKDDDNRMLSAYMDVVHSSFPLLDSLALADQFKRSNALLAAMCIVAAPFVKDCSIQARRDFTRYATEALHVERRYPKIETVEAALILIQRHAVIHRAPTTPGLWPELGTIIGMCHELGLNVDPTSWKITNEHRSRRIRLWWGIYIFDKFCAFGLGRPSYINDESWNVPMITMEAFKEDDPFVPLSSRQQFVAMANLSAILSRLLSGFYSLVAVRQLQNANAVEIQVLFLTFQQQLLEFRAQFIDTIKVEDGRLDPTGTVVLAYHTVEIALCRAVLRNLDPGTMECSIVRLYARNAVESIMNLLRKIQISQLRAYWWNPISEINFSLCGSFMFYLLLSSTDESEIDFWAMQIKEFRQSLELQEYGFIPTMLAATRMALFASVNEGVLAPTNTDDNAVSGAASRRGEFFDGNLTVELETK